MVKEHLSFTLDSDLRAALNAVAAPRRWSPSQTIREAIYRFLIAERSTTGHSFNDPTHDAHAYLPSAVAQTMPREDVTGR